MQIHVVSVCPDAHDIVESNRRQIEEESELQTNVLQHGEKFNYID